MREREDGWMAVCGLDVWVVVVVCGYALWCACVRLREGREGCEEGTRAEGEQGAGPRAGGCGCGCGVGCQRVGGSRFKLGERELERLLAPSFSLLWLWFGL